MEQLYSNYTYQIISLFSSLLNPNQLEEHLKDLQDQKMEDDVV